MNKLECCNARLPIDSNREDEPRQAGSHLSSQTLSHSMRSSLLAASFIRFTLATLMLTTQPLGAVIAAETDIPLTREQAIEFKDIFAVMKNSFVDPVEDSKLVNACLNGMVSGVDPDSRLIESIDFQDIKNAKNLGGLGLELGIKDGFVVIVSTIDNTPAGRSELRSGDLIIKVDDLPVKGMTLSDVVHLLRGPANSPVSLAVARKGEVRLITTTLQRALLKAQSVKSRLIEPRYAYLRVSWFNEDTGRTLVTKIVDIYKNNEIDGMILDLRNNPGGSLETSVAVAAVFLPANTPIVSVSSRSSSTPRTYAVTPSDYLPEEPDYQTQLPDKIKTVPLAVLVNEGTAGGAEIVVAALQEVKRATVVGATTYGRATIQTVLPLGDTRGIRLTTNRWYTPRGRSIQDVGIAPTVPVPDKAANQPPSASSDDKQLAEALSILKSARRELLGTASQ